MARFGARSTPWVIVRLRILSFGINVEKPIKWAQELTTFNDPRRETPGLEKSSYCLRHALCLPSEANERIDDHDPMWPQRMLVESLESQAHASRDRSVSCQLR